MLVVIALWSCGAAQAQERVEAAAGKRIMRVFVLGEDRQPLVAARLHGERTLARRRRVRRTWSCR